MVEGWKADGRRGHRAGEICVGGRGWVERFRRCYGVTSEKELGEKEIRGQDWRAN